MKVWRVEDNQGRGPYNAYPYTNEQLAIIGPMKIAHGHNHSHPFPQNDGLYDFLCKYDLSPKLVFGFLSEESAREWFDGYLEDLEKLGFKLKSFEAGLFKVSKSEKQLVFYRP